MRKILAGLMATAMVTSICATASFAAVTPATATFTATATAAAQSVTHAVLTVTEGGNAVDYSVPFVKEYDTTAKETVAADLKGLTFTNIKIADKYYSVKLSNPSGDQIVGTFSPAVEIPTVTVALDIQEADDSSAWTGSAAINGVVDEGAGAPTADVTLEGDVVTNVEDVILCDGSNNPIALTEKDAGVEKDRNGNEGVQASRTLYFMVKKGDYSFDDDTMWKLKVTKGDNGKRIKAVSDVSKNMGSPMYNVVTGGTIAETEGRHRFIKVELAEDFTDTEYKLTLDLRLTPETKALNVYSGMKDDVSIKVKDFSFYVKNITKTADNDWKVGINGLMLDPLGNDWNNVTYYDEDGDVAFMRFFGDSDVGKFYSKLSTKWAHEDYAAYFNDQDAFYFEFTGSPKLSSTSRADLQIYNPFVDEDGNETIDPTTATIYQVVDGDLIDVTDSFTYGEGENGDDAFITRTRFLGSYIICEKPVEEATGNADIEDIEPTTPEEVTPDNNNGGKNPANTGRYI